MNCGACKHANAPERNYCGACGALLARHCSLCGFRNGVADRFCGGCGAGLAPAGEAPRAAAPPAPGAPPVAAPAGLAELLQAARESVEAQEEDGGARVSQDDIDSLFGE